jgi:integrase
MTDLTGIDELPSGHFRVRVQHGGAPVAKVFATPDEALRFRDALKREIVDGEFVPVKGVTLHQIGPRFLASRSGNRDTKNDSSRWYKHLATAPFARKPLIIVTRADGVAWLDALKRKPLSFDPEKHGERPHKPISWQTRKHCLNLARRAFGWALDQQLYDGANPFNDLTVPKEDGDEDEGFQETWYLDPVEQTKLFKIWSELEDETHRQEVLIGQVAIGTAVRMQELWCLHLEDVHLEGDEPHIYVRYGSWDPIKERYRPPKGRRGERKPRRVPLFGLALDALRAWLAALPTYAKSNEHKLVFPTERGKRRQKIPPRSWPKVVEKFGNVARIGREPWWHLLRHTCASSLISGAWGMRWTLEDVSKMLGHTSVKTTEIYAHLAPTAVQKTATEAQNVWSSGCHGVVTPPAAVTRNLPVLLGTPGPIRTDDIRLRRPTLYPAELRARASFVLLRDGDPCMDLG